MLKCNSINVHCKFGARHKWEPAGHIGDFGNFLNSFAKTPRLIVLNIDLVQFVLKNCKILHSVWGLYDKKYCFTSELMWWIKTTKGQGLHIPRFVGKILESKKFGLTCFPRICFPGLIYCDQEPFWLMNVIKDDCYFLGAHNV